MCTLLVIELWQQLNAIIHLIKLDRRAIWNKYEKYVARLMCDGGVENVCVYVFVYI